MPHTYTPILLCALLTQGQDLSGMAALGGVCFFNVSAEVCYWYFDVSRGIIRFLACWIRGGAAPIRVPNRLGAYIHSKLAPMLPIKVY